MMTSIVKKEVYFMSNQFIYKSIFAPYFNSFLEMKKTMGFGLPKFQWIFLEFDNFFIETSPCDPYITREQITAWSNTRINDQKRTLYDKYSVLRQFCFYLCHLGNECYIPRMPKRQWPEFIPYIFTHEQIENIFKESDKLIMPNSNMNCVLFAIPALLRLLYSTGLRISEALSIKNEDVDFGHQRIILKKTKNQMQRLVPLNPSLLDALRQFKKFRDKMPVKGISAPAGFLFVSTIGKPLHHTSIYNWFRKILKECNIPHLGNKHGPRIHDIRHTCAVHSLIKQVGDGVDIYCVLPILSVFLGHKTIKGTESYVRLTQEMYPEIIKMEQSITSSIFPNYSKIKINYDND